MQIRKIVSNKFELPFFQAKTAQRYKNLKNGIMTNVCGTYYVRLPQWQNQYFWIFFNPQAPFGTAPFEKKNQKM